MVQKTKQNCIVGGFLCTGSLQRRGDGKSESEQKHHFWKKFNNNNDSENSNSVVVNNERQGKSKLHFLFIFVNLILREVVK